MKTVVSVLLALVLFGCRQSKLDNEAEYAVINAVLANIVQPASQYKKQALRYYVDEVKFPPPISKKLKREIDAAVNRQIDSIKKIPDTARVYLTIRDTLNRIPTFYLKHLQQISAAGLRLENFKYPAKVKEIAIALDTTHQICPIVKQSINNLPGYQIKFYNGRANESRNLLGPGMFVFSRVSFTSDRTKACIYVSNYCGILCGSDTIYFLEKVNGKWKLFDQRTLTIS